MSAAVTTVASALPIKMTILGMRAPAGGADCFLRPMREAAALRRDTPDLAGCSKLSRPSAVRDHVTGTQRLLLLDAVIVSGEPWSRGDQVCAPRVRGEELRHARFLLVVLDLELVRGPSGLAASAGRESSVSEGVAGEVATYCSRRAQERERGRPRRAGGGVRASSGSSAGVGCAAAAWGRIRPRAPRRYRREETAQTRATGGGRDALLALMLYTV